MVVCLFPFCWCAGIDRPQALFPPLSFVPTPLHLLCFGVCEKRQLKQDAQTIASGTSQPPTFSLILDPVHLQSADSNALTSPIWKDMKMPIIYSVLAIPIHKLPNPIKP